jgi:hypothetical protein
MNYELNQQIFSINYREIYFLITKLIKKCIYFISKSNKNVYYNQKKISDLNSIRNKLRFLCYRFYVRVFKLHFLCCSFQIY